MERVEYTDEFEIKRYFEISGQLLGIVVLGFMFVSIFQTWVQYPSVMEAALTNGGIPTPDLSGCNVSPQSNALGTTCGYFIHNSSIALLSWIGGFAVIGPLFVIWDNGMNIGYYIGKSITDPASLGTSWSGTAGNLAFLLPHGIIEIPAIILSLGLGLYVSNEMIDLIEDPTHPTLWSIWSLFRHSFPYFILVIGMLGLAAYIESTISPEFASWAESII